MKNVMRGIHAAYAGCVFAVLFVVFFFLLLIPILFPACHHLTGVFNRWWARTFFGLTFFPIQIEYHPNIKSGRQYIFCPNHFSYLDIPTMGLNRFNTVFVGKNDMERIPLFGFMYRKLHITVDRESLKSKYNTLLKSKEAIDEGKNLVIFPEGGIITTDPPRMTRFKDGAFRVAIDKQIPIIPVTIPFNWIILPDSTWLPRLRVLKIIFHEPIDTQGLTLADLNELKEKTFRVIDQELNRQLK